MKLGLLLIAIVAPAFMAGCSGDEAPMKTDPSAVMNPSGKTENLPPQAQGLGAQQKAAGEAAKRNMDEMAREMKAAQAKTGGR